MKFQNPSCHGSCIVKYTKVSTKGDNCKSQYYVT